MKWSDRHCPHAMIAGAFALVCLAALALGGLALDRLGTVDGYAATLRTNYLGADIALARILEETAKVRLHQNMSLIALTEAAREKERSAVGRAVARVDALIGEYAASAGADQRGAFEKWRTAWNEYVSMNDTLNEKALNENLKTAIEYYLYPMNDVYRLNFLAAINNHLAFNFKSGEALARAGEAAYAEARQRIAAATIAVVLLCLLSAYFFVSVVMRPARHAADEATEPTDAAHRIDEIAELIDDIAERTNLIALNAAIEASRSGRSDAGAGGDAKAAASQVLTASRALAEQAGALKEAMQTFLIEAKAA